MKYLEDEYLENPNRYFRRMISDFGRRRDGIYLGEDQDSGSRIFLNDKDRATHVHILGSTGEGKSKLIELMIREDILAGRGLCLIDPHGFLYEDIVNFCASKNLPHLKNKIILFNPARDDFVIGYDPLQRTSKDISQQVDSMVLACCRVWGAENMDQTPLLKKWLRNIFFTLIEKNLTLLEAQYLLDPVNGELRRVIANALSEPFIEAQWNYLSNLKSPKQIQDELGSSLNRMMEFLSSARMRRILAQKEKSLNFRKIMDEGYILLVNLSSGQRVSRDNARMLGTLIVNDFFLAATERPKNSRPFYLYIDEFGQFVNQDIGDILDQCRKFGLHLILAHQHLQQLKKEEADVSGSVLTNAKTHIVFGGSPPDDAELMAKTMFDFDIDEIKRVIYQTKFRPIETTRIVRGYTESIGSSESEGESEGYSGGESHQFIPQPLSILEDQEVSYNISSSFSSSKSRGSGWQESESYSESEVPWYEYEEFREASTIADRPLEEQLYRAMQIMRNQPTRDAMIKIGKNKLRAGRIRKVEEPYVSERRVKEFKERCYLNSPFSLLSEEAEKIMEGRIKLLTEAKIQLTEAIEPKSFRIPRKELAKPSQS